jgi:heptosyltransferase III
LRPQNTYVPIKNSTLKIKNPDKAHFKYLTIFIISFYFKLLTFNFVVMRFLIVRPDRLGDMILTLPMAAALRQAHPGDTIIVLGSEYNAVLAEICPDVDEVIIVKSNATLVDLASAIKKARADVAFFPVARFRLALAAWISRIPTRVGTGYRWYSFLFNKKMYDHRKTAERNEADFNVRMLRATGIEIGQTPLPHLSLPKPEVIGLPEHYCVFHIPVGGSAPPWGTDNFIHLINELSGKNEWDIILTGSQVEREFLFTVAAELKHLGSRIHIRTKDSLIELAYVLRGARLVVSGSTGPGHIAAALGTPSIGLFPLNTPLSRERWGFRGQRAINLAPLEKLKSECPNCKECSCIGTITLQQVLGAVNRLGI